jgi:DNA-directed RNA polymerase sigma subunit (sigma70/sigma32)
LEQGPQIGECLLVLVQRADNNILFADSIAVDAVSVAEIAICSRWNSSLHTQNSEDEDEHVSDIVDDEEALMDDPFETDSGLSPWDQLGEGFERDAANISRYLTGICSRR